MKKFIVILVFLSFSGFHLTGCTTTYGKVDPEQKHALRILAGGVVGALVSGSTGGAIVGALVVDIYGLTRTKYEDKQLENAKEAAEKYKNGQKAEEKKVEEKKGEDKKAEEKKEKEKKVGEKKGEDKRVELIIEESLVANQNVRTGSTIEANVQYTLLAPSDTQQIKITETRILSYANKRMEVDKRDVLRTQGTYISKITFIIPDDIPKGYCILFTTISDGKYFKTAKSIFNVI